MRKFLTTATAVAAAALLVLAGSPARAGEVSWKDPEGDATRFPVASAPRPSEPEYDVLKVTVVSAGDKLDVVADMKKLGTIPPYSQGNVYRFFFTAGDVSFILSVIEDVVNGTGSTFSVVGPAGSTSADCFKCTGKIDVKQNKILMSMPLGSLEGARRAAGGTQKIVPGAELTKLRFSGGEYYALPNRLLSLNFVADDAVMPDPGKIVL